jgi:hypothetical protein
MNNYHLFSSRKLAVLALTLSFLNPAVAQNKYQPGFIIEQNGDTLKGWINHNWEKQPGRVFFKDEKNSIHTYSPVNIRGYGTGNRFFQSAFVITETTNTNINQLNYTEKLQLVADTVFLETIIRGTKNLMYYHNLIGKEQYYIGQEHNYELLKHKKFLRLIDGKPHQMEDKSYMKQIADYLGECPEVSMKINETVYSYKHLEKIFMVYYNCKGNIEEFHKKKAKTKLNLGVLLGVTKTNMAFKSPYFSYLVNGKTTSSIDLTGGGFFEVGLGRTKKNLFLNNEVIFTSYKFDISHEDYVDPNNYTITNSTLAFSYLRLNNMVRYRFYLPGAIVFANFGITNSFAISQTNKNSVEKKFFASETKENGKALDDTRKIESGWNIGAGASFKKYIVQFRFESTNGMSSYQVLNSRLHKSYILLGYQF